MGIESRSGETYRLIVAIDRRILLADERRYSRFEDAQAEVAGAVRRFSHLGNVSAIALQRGRPSLVPKRNGNGNGNGVPHSPLLNGADYLWTLEKRWGREVVTRILSQNGVPARGNGYTLPGNGCAHPVNGYARPGNGHARPGNGRPTPRLPAPPRPRSIQGRRHKNTRWQVMTTLAAILLSMLVLVFAQTGGHPTRLLTVFDHPHAATKEDLPFDAPSFESEPSAHETPAADRKSGLSSSTSVGKRGSRMAIP